MLHSKYILWCICGDSDYFRGPLQENNHAGTSDYRNNIVTLCYYLCGTVGARPRKGGANTGGDQSGQIHYRGPDSVGDTQDQGRTRRLHQRPRGGLTSQYIRKGNKPQAAGPVGQGQRPDSYARLLIVCLIILPPGPRAIGRVPDTSDSEPIFSHSCLSQGHSSIHVSARLGFK